MIIRSTGTLSVHMSEHEPSVSMISSFFTNTLQAPILSAVIYRRAVTVDGKPSGTLERMITMKPLMKVFRGSKPLRKKRKKTLHQS